MIHNTEFETEDYKTITVAKLIEILQRLPPEAEIWTNRVKNLSVGHNLVVVGHIDLADDTYERYEH